MSFGWRYDFKQEAIAPAPQIPEFLIPVREIAARSAGSDADTFQQALVTEYQAGTTIGWHRDKGVFNEVLGVSLLSECTFRFRKRNAENWERYSLELEPRSVYRLSGEIRNAWEHSIPAVQSLRYSITFRSLQ